MSGINQLLTLARVYGDATGAEQSTVSWRALGDTKKLAAIEAGRDIQVRRLEKTIQWFSDHWPDSQPWPAEIDRPEPHKARASA